MSRTSTDKSLRVELAYDPDNGGASLRLRFSYSEEFIADLKRLGGFRWFPGGKYWYMPATRTSFDNAVEDVFAGKHPMCGLALQHGMNLVFDGLVEPSSQVPATIKLMGAHGDGAAYARAFASAVNGLQVSLQMSRDEVLACIANRVSLKRASDSSDIEASTDEKVAQVRARAAQDDAKIAAQHSDDEPLPEYSFSDILARNMGSAPGTVQWSLLPFAGSGADAVREWTLFKHQAQALNAFRHAVRELPPMEGRNASGRRLLIAHEMGLGKTVTGVAIANVFHGPSRWRALDNSSMHSPQRGRVVVVCPEHLRLDWARTFRVTGREALVYGIDKQPGLRWKASNWAVLIIGAASIAKDTMDALGVGDLSYDLLILDEAHYFKNKDAQRTQAVLKQQERVSDIVLLTGTPQLKAPIDLYTPLFITAPKDYANFYKFATRYCNAKKTKLGWDFSGASNIGELHEKLKRVMHRKLKSAVADLPEKTRTVVPLVVSDEIKKRTFEALREAAKLVANGKKPNAVKGAISKLRADMWAEKQSAAMQWLRSFLDGNPTQKLVVMTWHVETAKSVATALRTHLNPLSQGVAEFTGANSLLEKEASYKNFQSHADTRVIVGTIAAMGTGLTLTAASNLAFVEFDWTPGTMLQAEDRIHRISQKNACSIWYLVAGDTVDEIQVRSLVRKMATINQVVDGGKAGEFDELAGWLSGAHDAFAITGAELQNAARELTAAEALAQSLPGTAILPVDPPQKYTQLATTSQLLHADFPELKVRTLLAEHEARLQQALEHTGRTLLRGGHGGCDGNKDAPRQGHADLGR